LKSRLDISSFKKIVELFFSYVSLQDLSISIPPITLMPDCLKPQVTPPAEQKKSIA
jgi:hypothetical protein